MHKNVVAFATCEQNIFLIDLRNICTKLRVDESKNCAAFAPSVCHHRVRFQISAGADCNDALAIMRPQNLVYFACNEWELLFLHDAVRPTLHHVDHAFFISKRVLAHSLLLAKRGDLGMVACINLASTNRIRKVPENQVVLNRVHKHAGMLVAVRHVDSPSTLYLRVAHNHASGFKCFRRCFDHI